MKIPFYIGWVLLLTAFALASAEVLVRSITGGTYLLIPALELWYTLSPGSLSIAQIRIENVFPALWDPVLIHLLVLPAWAIFGFPGCLMIAIFRPRKATDWRDREEARKHEDSLMLYDALTRDAVEQGMADETDGRLPDHSVLEALEKAGPEEIPDPELVLDNALEAPPEYSREDFDNYVRGAGVEPRKRPPLSENKPPED